MFEGNLNGKQGIDKTYRAQYMGIQIEPDQDQNMQYTGVAKNASKINSYDECNMFILLLT